MQITAPAHLFSFSRTCQQDPLPSAQSSSPNMKVDSRYVRIFWVNKNMERKRRRVGKEGGRKWRLNEGGKERGMEGKDYIEPYLIVLHTSLFWGRANHKDHPSQMTHLRPASTLPPDSLSASFCKPQVPVLSSEMLLMNEHSPYCNSLNKIISLIVLYIMSFTEGKKHSESNLWIWRNLFWVCGLIQDEVIQTFNLFQLHPPYIQEKGTSLLWNPQIITWPRKKTPLLAVMAYVFLSLGHRMNSGTCVNSSFGGLEQIVESVFSFLLGWWTGVGGRFALTKVAQRERLVWGKK